MREEDGPNSKSDILVVIHSFITNSTHNKQFIGMTPPS